MPRIYAALGFALVLPSDAFTALAPAATASPAAQTTSSTPARQPLVPVFDVRRYEIVGGAALDQPAIDQAMRKATGPGISAAQIRRALLNLRQAYRDRGYLNAAINLPQQPLTNGVVQVRVVEGPAETAAPSAVTPSATALASWTVPAYDVRHFIVRGNTTLPVEKIDEILGAAAGPVVSLEQLQKALAQLQTAYRERGLDLATVTLPQQLLTDGAVTVHINEGLTPLATGKASPSAESTPSPTAAAPAGPVFEVKRYEVAGNTLLRPETIDQVLTNATGPVVTLPQIQKALGELQLAYRERGFATVSVSLPQQQLANGVVKVQVTEGALVDIQVVGNRHFTSNNVMQALPSLRTNQLLNSRVFQRELDIANQNRDRQIYPTIGPGPEPGTSALTLRVKDRLPLHGRIDVNNHSTPGTPEWRVNASAQYNNLWQRDHQMGLSYGFTPEAFKSGGLVSDFLLNRPLIANYGGYYRLPFGTAESVAEQINSSAAFGYDEATRQFRLPPAGARPDLSFFASGSSSDTGVQLSRASVVSQTPLLTIVSQDSGQNLTVNESAGSRLSVPLVLSDTKRWSFSGGPDWKRYSLESFNTNNFIITTVVTNAQGSQTIESRVASPQPARRNEVNYLPLSIGADYSQSDKQGTFAANFGLSGNFLGGADDFAAAAYSADAKATYGKASLSLTRDQKVFTDWSLLLRASGQAASGPLISNEQFALGGLNSVRGYFEGDQYGDAGWFGSAELRTPFLATRLPAWANTVPVWLRASVFMDYGQRFLMDSPAGGKSLLPLWGTGVGVSANINNHVDLRITVGWPLLDSPNKDAGEPRAYFSIGGQF